MHACTTYNTHRQPYLWPDRVAWLHSMFSLNSSAHTRDQRFNSFRVWEMQGHQTLSATWESWEFRAPPASPYLWRKPMEVDASQSYLPVKQISKHCRMDGFINNQPLHATASKAGFQLILVLGWLLRLGLDQKRSCTNTCTTNSDFKPLTGRQLLQESPVKQSPLSHTFEADLLFPVHSCLQKQCLQGLRTPWRLVTNAGRIMTCFNF